jgi:hypothetical protein
MTPPLQWLQLATACPGWLRIASAAWVLSSNRVARQAEAEVGWCNTQEPQLAAGCCNVLAIGA